MLALVGLPAVVGTRVDRYQLAHVLVWLHLALTSIRNAPLFALAAAPALAALINGLPLSHRSSWTEPGRKPVWIPAIVASVLVLLIAGVPLGKFDEQPLAPVGAAGPEPSAVLVAALPRARLGRTDRGRMPADPAGLTSTTVSSSSARSRSSNTSTSCPAARPGTPSATATGSTWSGSSPTGGWRRGC